MTNDRITIPDFKYILTCLGTRGEKFPHRSQCLTMDRVTSNYLLGDSAIAWEYSSSVEGSVFI